MVTLQEYKILDGQWTFPDSGILWFYQNLQRREALFYNVADLDRWNPLGYFKNARTFFGFVDGVCVGAMWITGWNNLNKTGFINFGSLKKMEDNPAAKVGWGLDALRQLLAKPDFQLLYGETSVSNKPALVMAKYAGFQVVGSIPGAHWNAREQKFEDTIFMWITKEYVR